MQGRIRWDDVKRWPENETTSLFGYVLKLDDVVIALDRTWVSAGLKVAALTAADVPSLLVQRVARVRSKKSLDQRLLQQVLRTYAFKAYVLRSQTATAVPHISPNDIREFAFTFPPFKEQMRIVAILDAWDQAIDQMERLINTKRKRLRGLINGQLFGSNAPASTGLSLTAKRVTGSNSWPLRKVGDFTREVSIFNRQDKQLPVLSCTKHDGLVLSDDYFGGRRIYSDDVSRYKVVERGQFAYATNHLEEGSIGLQSVVDTGLVSPMYTVFDVDDSIIDRKFLITTLKTETYRQVFEINTSSSVDRRGGLRWEDFAALPFALPSLEVQKHLAAAVETLEADLSTSIATLKSLRKQKRGLMQKLLTGEWLLDERFSVSTLKQEPSLTGGVA